MLRVSTRTLQNLFLSRANRPQSGMAAWQVVRLSEMLNLSDAKVLSLLSREVLTIIDLEEDNMIDSRVNRSLFEKIYPHNPPEGADYIEIPEETDLTHADFNFNSVNPAYGTFVEPVIEQALDAELTNRVPNGLEQCTQK